MIEIKDLLLRFQNILLKGELKKEIVRGIISKVLKIEIKKEDITIKNNIVYLNIKPIYKNEIFIKKNQILDELEKALGHKMPSDLR